MNGFPLALAALLAPAAVLAHASSDATPVAAEPVPEQVIATASAADIDVASPVVDPSAAAGQLATPETTTVALAQSAGTEAPAPEDPSAAQQTPAVDATAVDGPAVEAASGERAPTVEAGAPVANPDLSATTTQDGASQDDTTTPAEPAPASTAPTDAERDFADIYGTQGYNPVADSTLPEPATMPGTFDPWEKYNRQMHRFNYVIDRRVAKPLARGYVKVVPRPVRLGVSNFFNNLSQPLTMVNSLLQGKPKQAGQSLGRFLLNSTVGVAGLFDPATRVKLPNRSEDFGQTLGVWGWKRSRYVELPLFGPRTVRDVFGMVGDAPLSPLRRIEEDSVRIPLQGLQLVDMRAQLLSTDSLREGAADDYTLVRDAWSQRRDYQIFGDRLKNGEDLPDYLRDDEDDSTVPIDAMPVLVPGGS
ncbi:MlaA family lipoprotein [Lysobacter fragariae]